MLSYPALLCLTATSSRVSNGCKHPTNLKGSDSLQHGLSEVFVTCHMRGGFANSTFSRWNPFASEVITFWPSAFSKEKLTLTRLISSSAHHEPVYEGTHTDYCRYQAIFDSAAVHSPFELLNYGTGFQNI